MNNEGCRYARTSKSNKTKDAVIYGSPTVLCSIWPFFCCPQVMKKSVIGADFEKKDAVPPYQESKQALKLKRRVSLSFLLHTSLAHTGSRIQQTAEVTSFFCSGGEGEDHRRRLVQYESPRAVSRTERRPPDPEDEGLLGSQEVLQEEWQRWFS